jgi:hypothetical protein
MLPKSTAMLQTEQSILGDVRGDVGKIGDKGGESPPKSPPVGKTFHNMGRKYFKALPFRGGLDGAYSGSCWLKQ